MAKFMILYNSTTSASETMANSTPEQMKASMEEWMAWKTEAEKSAKFEWGLPLQPVTRITSTGKENSPNEASGYAIMEGDKETITTLLLTHPQLKRAGGTIDVLEMIPMPGM